MRLTGTITAIFFWFSKIGKISFQKGKKRKRENRTFGINFADLLLGHKPKKYIFSLNFATIKQLFRCTIRIYLTNYYLPINQMVIHCWHVTSNPLSNVDMYRNYKTVYIEKKKYV